MSEILSGRPVSRRRFVGQSVAAALLLGCDKTGVGPGENNGDGRLHAIPGQPAGTAVPGDFALGLDAPRDGRLYIPPGYDPGRPAPLVLGLHGAGSTGSNWNRAMQPAADASGVVLLAPDSRGYTWDAIGGSFGPDVDFIDRALADVYGKVNIDPAHIAIAGFSDGATYALSLGLANGDLLGSVIAFSPGFVVSATRHGHPRFFVAHGTSDTVLPIDACSRRIVPDLQRSGYDVTYHEFDGGHAISTVQRDAAFAWLLAT